MIILLVPQVPQVPQVPLAPSKSAPTYSLLYLQADLHQHIPTVVAVLFWLKVVYWASSMKQLLNQVINWKHYLQRYILPLVLMLLTTLLVTPTASAANVYQMQQLSSGDRTWVIDQAEVLSRINENKISSDLEKLAQATGNEVRLVTIRRLDYGETPESFAKALFEKWFPTKEAQANQTLLLIDKVSNNTAIVTGDRVKSQMSDEIADSIANETLVAPLRQGEKYNQAFLDASDRIIAVLSGKPDPGPPQVAALPVEGSFKKADEAEKGNATVWVVGLLLAATIIPMATYYLYVR